MNGFSISITKPGTKKYPLHSHKHWEIMFYLEGDGFLATKGNNIPFTKGSIIIVPPDTVHGSVSQNGFVNISIGGDFGKLLMFDTIIALQDNGAYGSEQLARLIYLNRHLNNDYLASLCTAYLHSILQSFIYEKKINRVINDIVNEASLNFSDPEFNITDLLSQSGYAEDYIRNEFKKATGLTPLDLVAKMRIQHARQLIDIYGESLSVAEISTACGFDDPIYFSRRFKQFLGTSPKKYLLISKNKTAE